MKTFRLALSVLVIIMAASLATAQGIWTQYQPRIPRILDLIVQNDELLCLSERNVYRVNPTTIKYEEMFSSGSYGISFIEKSPGGDILVGYGTKFYLLHNDTWKSYQYSEFNTDIRYPGLEFRVPFTYDKDGICWMAGHGIGLIRFDGENFTKIPDFEFPQDDRVSSICAGSDGRIWIGTAGGLYCYDGETIELMNYSKDNSGLIVCVLFGGLDGSVWVGTAFNGILHYKDGSWIQYIPESNGEKYVGVTSLLIDKSGTIWASLRNENFDYTISFNTLFKYDGETWAAYHDPISDGLELNSLTIGPGGALWASSPNITQAINAGLLRFDGEKWTNSLYNELLPADLKIQDLVYFDGSLVLPTSNDGVYEYNGSTWTQIFNTVTDTRSAAVSPDGTIWVGTPKELYYSDGISWTPVSSTVLSDNNNYINRIAADSEGNIWCATKNSLIRFDGSDWKVYDESDGISGSDFSTLAVDPDGDIWVGYLSDENVSEIAVYDGEKWTQTTIDEISNRSTVKKIVSGPAGEAWVIMQKALLRYDGGKWVQVPCNCQQIVDITCDTKGVIYLKTDKGVERYDGEQWTTYTSGDGAPYVSYLTAGDNGTIYGVANSGIFARFDPDLTPSAVGEPLLLPEICALKGNFPNPFNMSTTIHFELPSESFVDLAVFSITGQKIRTLVSEWKNPGSYSVMWDGLDDFGRVVSSGIYLNRLRGGELSVSRRMMFLK